MVKISELIKREKIARRDLYSLLELITGHDRSFLLAHPELELDKNQAVRFQKLADKLAGGFPLQYIAGETWFYGLRFRVSRHTLIPRPETEVLVEQALLIAATLEGPEILDIGSGCGCIIISLASEIKKTARSCQPRFSGVDISAPALALARRNARDNRVKDLVKFYQGDLLSPILKKKPAWPADIIICANLPYLTPQQIKNSPGIRFEPSGALNGGRDGLDLYRRLIDQLVVLKTLSQATIYCLWEIDDTQAVKTETLISKSFPSAEAQIKKDHSGYARVAVFKL